MEVKKTKRTNRTQTKTILTLLCLVIGIFAAISSTPIVKATTYSYVVAVNSQSYDGYAYDEESLWSIARNSTTADVIDATNIFASVGYDHIDGPYYGTYKLYRSYLYFDTSFIPSSATIDNATLSIKISATDLDSNFNVTIQNGQPTYPHSPFTIYDYYHNYYSGNGGNVSTSGMSADSYINMTMTSLGLTYIRPVTTTKICLRADADDIRVYIEKTLLKR